MRQHIWIPASAGMTKKWVAIGERNTVTPAKAGVQIREESADRAASAPADNAADRGNIAQTTAPLPGHGAAEYLSASSRSL